jgi:hypothetical protein
MPFASAPGRAPLTRVYDRNSVGHRKSMKTHDPDLVVELQGMVERFRRQRRWSELEAIIADRVTMPQVYEADCSGTLAALMANLVVEDAARLAEASDPDLSPLVAQWA